MTIYVLCGLPASGKTTLSKILAKEHSAKLYCYDDCKSKGIGLYQQIKKELIYCDIVLDAMFVTKMWRKELLNVIKDVDCKKVIVVLNTPVDVCVERNTLRGTYPSNGAIYHLSKQYEQPTLDEGWDEILYY